VLDAAGLSVALERLCAESEERAGARVVLDAPRDARSSHDRLVFELARELLGNAGRHAQASRIDVSLHRDDGQLVLTVADDGRGMEPDSRAEALRAGHIGLASFAERVAHAGGRLDIESATGRGTTVTARLPL
jgi:two-component system, NarL family, sensor kinase